MNQFYQPGEERAPIQPPQYSREPDDIKKLIASLQKEARSLKKDEYDNDMLLRLEEMLKEYNGEDRVISSLDLVEAIKNRPPQHRVMTGYKGLDEILDGFRYKQLIVLAAPTKSGKTTFAIELTSRLKDERPLWLPFEEPAEEIIQKFLDRNEPPPLFYVPEKMLGNTMLWIEKKMIEAKAKYNSRIVFIDHLHFIVPFIPERQDLAIGEAMRSLKKLAVKWDMTVVLIAHLKKTKMDTQPDLEDLRDSSFIAQEADTVIMLWRKMERVNGEVQITNNVNVSVQANRRTGKTGNVKMVYENGRFLEQEWRMGDDVKGKEIW